MWMQQEMYKIKFWLRGQQRRNIFKGQVLDCSFAPHVSLSYPATTAQPDCAHLLHQCCSLSMRLQFGPCCGIANSPRRLALAVSRRIPHPAHLNLVCVLSTVCCLHHYVRGVCCVCCPPGARL